MVDLNSTCEFMKVNGNDNIFKFIMDGISGMTKALNNFHVDFGSLKTKHVREILHRGKMEWSCRKRTQRIKAFEMTVYNDIKNQSDETLIKILPHVMPGNMMTST